MNPSKAALKLDWCSHEAAKWAVEHWHYSKSMPTPPIVKIGVWENGQFIGVVLFSRGANNNLGKPYGLAVTEVCELTRVALNQHKAPVSRIVAVAIKLVRKQSDGLRLIVSFADPNHQHVGTIYQAGGWTYGGMAKSTPKYIAPNGQILHQRQVSKTGVKPQYGRMRRVPKTDDCQEIPQLDKYRYLYPLDDAMRAQIAPLAKPYPKRAGVVQKAEQPGPPAEGGASPTRPLQVIQAGASHG